MDNKKIRRSLRKFIEHLGPQDTRKMTALFSKAYKTTRQRIAGNLRTMKYDEKSIQIITHVPGQRSIMY